MTVLVTGATGAIGPYVVDELVRAGMIVRCFSRRRPVRHDVEWVEGDIRDSAAVKVAVAGCEAVVHLAALLHIVSPPESLWPEYEAVNVTGTANVVAAALASGVARVVFVSTIAVYGGNVPQADERTPPASGNFYCRTKLQAEQIVLAARDAQANQVGTVLRAGAVYGSGLKGNYRSLVRAIDRGMFVPIGKGENRRTVVYVRDFARAVSLALARDDARGEIFNVTDGRWYRVTEIVSTISAALGRRPPQWHVPIRLAMSMAATADATATLMGRRRRFRAMVEKYTEDVAVSGERIQRTLGFRPVYSLEDGWQETIDEMRRSGEL